MCTKESPLDTWNSVCVLKEKYKYQLYTYRNIHTLHESPIETRNSVFWGCSLTALRACLSAYV